MTRTFRALLFVVIVGWSLASVVKATDYTANGPCASEKIKSKVTISKRSKLQATVTLPTRQQQSANCPVAPYPIVVFFSGFSTPSLAYSAYAAKLASYGYGVVQYDVLPTLLSPLPITTDAAELKFLAPLLTELSASSTLAGRLDFNTVAVAGHSRGGKLAALHLASNSSIRTGYLIDPVDNTVFSPESPAYPSAVKALKQVQPPRTAGVSGSGIPSACNPQESNYIKFYNALGAGSWLSVLPGATHLAFAGLPDLLCGKGNTTAEVAVQLTSTALTAWMEGQIRNKPTAEFQAWAKAQAPVLLFSVKP